MKTTILTAIYDDYDLLKQTVPQSIDVEWVCVTDNQYLTPAKNRDGWRIVHEPRSYLSPRFAAKLPKMTPWLYTNTETSIWIDASFQVKSERFAEEILQYATPLAQFVHPWRNCCYQEAKVCLQLRKDTAERIHSSIKLLETGGHPKEWGLWATGIIARRHTSEVVQMGFDWLAKVYEYSYRDQITHPMVCREHGLRPVNLPGVYFDHEWLQYNGSKRHG